MAFSINLIGLRDEVIAALQQAQPHPRKVIVDGEEQEVFDPDPLLDATKQYVTQFLGVSAQPTTGIEVRAESLDGHFHMFVTRRQLAPRLPLPDEDIE